MSITQTNAFIDTDTPVHASRASNGRDVPVAGRNVWLPDDVIEWYAAHCGDLTGSPFPPAQVAVACRRALGDS